MKKLVFIVLIAITANLYSQSKSEMLAELNGQYNVDENGNVTIFKVLDSINLSKDEIYNRALNYFTYNYVSGKSVIQSQDKEKGNIVAKGIYENVHTGTNASLATFNISTWHIIRVDIKDNKARIIISLTNYDQVISGGNSQNVYKTSFIKDEFPINPKGYYETIMTKAFYKSYKKALSSLNAIEKTIKEGNTSKSIEQSNW